MFFGSNSLVLGRIQKIPNFELGELDKNWTPNFNETPKMSELSSTVLDLSVTKEQG